jgi:hypothetical protein
MLESREVESVVLQLVSLSDTARTSVLGQRTPATWFVFRSSWWLAFMELARFRTLNDGKFDVTCSWVK